MPASPATPKNINFCISFLHIQKGYSGLGSEINSVVPGEGGGANTFLMPKSTQRVGGCIL